MKKKPTWEVIRLAGMLIFFYLIIWLRVDTSLIYHSLGMLYQGRGMTALPVFYSGWAFFSDLTAAPGGMVEYLSAFLYQYYFYPSAGALIATAVALTIYLATNKIISDTSGFRFAVISYLPVLLILTIFCEYTLCLALCVGLSLSLLGVLGYMAVTGRATFSRAAVFLTTSIILYYLAGGAFLIYAVLCTALEYKNHKRLLPGLTYLLAAILMPYVVGAVFFNLSISDAYTLSLPFHPQSYSNQSIAARALVLFFPALALWVVIQRPAAGLARRVFSGRSVLNEEPANQPPARRQRATKVVFVFEMLAIIIAASSVVYFRFDEDLKTALSINSFARRQMWSQVLKEARRLPAGSYNILTSHDIDNALFHSGRLPCDLFAYTQVRSQGARALLHLNFGFGRQTESGSAMAELSRLSDVYFELGLINPAELTAYVNLELNEHPSILKQLFFINMAKGNAETARVYLRALSKNPVMGKWAVEQLSLSQTDPLFSTDKHLNKIRSNIPVNDYVQNADTEIILLDLLEHNRHNRMAFEYLMAYYLLSFELEKAARCIQRLGDFDYPGIPPLYEEAVLVCQSQSGREVDLRGKTISAETYERFYRFRELYTRYKQNNADAFRQLENEFADSYFFYCMFGRSGKKHEQ